MTQEVISSYKLTKWRVTTTNNEFLLSEKEFDALMEAEKRNVRIVRFNDFAINPAFVTSAKKENSAPFIGLPSKDEKYLSEEDRIKFFPSGDRKALNERN